MAKKIPKEMIEHWEAQLKGIEKPRGYKEITYDPQVLAAIVKGQQKQGKEKLNLKHEMLIGAFYKVFEKLPVRQKQALGLYFGLNRHKALTQEEIATEMQISQPTVCLLIINGKKQLKKRVKKFLASENFPSKK